MLSGFDNSCALKKAVVMIGAIFTALLTSCPISAYAATFVAERAALGSNDQLDWSSLGKVFNPLAPDPTALLPNSFPAVSEGGLDLNIEIPPATLPSITPPFVFKTGMLPTGIPTNFAEGDFILFTGFTPPGPDFVPPAIGNPGPLTITFDTPVLGVGTQLAVDDIPNFTGLIQAFDRFDSFLASFEAPGTSSIALDNSAAFFGIRSDKPDIAKLVLSSSSSQNALGINALSIVSEAVPEPGAILGLIVLAGMGLSLKRKGTVRAGKRSANMRR